MMWSKCGSSPESFDVRCFINSENCAYLSACSVDVLAILNYEVVATCPGVIQ